MTRAPGKKQSSALQPTQAVEEHPKLASRSTVAEKDVTIKDATELKLEKLLFGDDVGFLNNISEQNQELAFLDDYGSDDDADDFDEASDGHEDEEGDQSGLRDEDLFMIDTTGTDGVPGTDLALMQVDQEEEEDDRPAWEDSDDERLTISLASHSRLRKLRHTEADDIVNGKEYSRRLREQYERLHPTPEWAQKTSHRKKRRRTLQNLDEDGSEVSISDEDEDMDEDSYSAQPLAQLLQSAESLLDNGSKSSKSRQLRSGTIDIQRLRDVSDPQPSAVASLSFHPTVSPPLLLSSGPSGLLSMHHISAISGTSSQTPANNPLLTSLAVPTLAIDTSTFHPSGSRIFFAGRRRYFHIWDLPSGTVSKVSRITGQRDSQRSCENFKLSPCGRYMALVGTARKGGGVANILDATTGQWIAQARAEGKHGVSDLAWWRNGEGLVVLSKSGEVVEYSIADKRVIARWRDQGAVGSTVVALGGQLPGSQASSRKNGLGPDRWVAIGSQSGIVNIYDRVEWSVDKLAASPEPRKVMDQLVTPTSHLRFSPDGQLLVMASRWKKDALKLIHLPSCTVFKNWPTSNAPLGRITSIAWAPNGRLLATGNEAGKVRLWEIRG